MNSQNLRWRQGWRKNGGEAFTLNPFTYNVLRSEGEEVNTKVENRRMRACMRPRKIWRNVHGWRSGLVYWCASRVSKNSCGILREKVDDFQRLSGCFCRDAQWFSEQMGFRYLGWCSNDAVYTIFAQVPFSPKIIGYSLIAFLLLFFPLVYVSRLNGVVVPCKNTGSIRHGVPAI